jgi:NAD(P)H-dependent flavin oxidoreductase YrpB (nitropropane dioxygenase family)
VNTVSPIVNAFDFYRYGASGVWVGTRFVASEEAGAPPKHKELVLSAGYDDIVRTLIYSGRPMSVRKTPYVASWYAYF